ncbi:2'-5' RNA ligase [Actinopolymorpha cephalotaxi]|uniref:2'-5' RNA ligase n=1 Tax=Actinopolymorpha cephalotaxi TaxID=504797 RepID=A0A1I2KU49_9ACTN|nr:2'-5' RNA ligase family protein [Actinopolymorpha cephalotaxi]NYH84640.1 2'-5' RNA ligase [Actinopolymorpha cephalotaxi]SFF69858.1 2'-5' RNA ligase [Actinopolymorpha cephalotaxi]
MRTIGVAVAIPEPYGGELQRWRAAFGDPLADAIPTHVTLLPPTQVDNDAMDTMDAIERHLLTVAESAQPFTMRLRGTATFRPVSPVVFVAVAEGISSCELLAEGVRSGPLRRDLAFPYHPHVTVAHDLPHHVLDKAYEALDTYTCAFTVQTFSLFEHGTDLVWRPQRDFALGGPLPGPVPPDES